MVRIIGFLQKQVCTVQLINHLPLGRQEQMEQNDGDYDVKKEEGVSTRRRKRTANKDEVKQEDSASNAQKNRRGRPKKNPDISSQTALEQIKKNGNSMSEENEPKAIKKEHQTTSRTSRKRRESSKPKLADPNETDLCEALLLLRNKLPNRSLEKTIIRLFETVEEKQRNKESIFSKSQVDSRTQRDLETAFSDRATLPPPLPNSTENRTQQYSTAQFENKEGGPRTDRLVVPGRKVSRYHDRVGEVAALSHEYYKNNTPGVAEIDAMQEKMAKTPLYAKPRAASQVAAEQKLQESAITHNVHKKRVFHFRESETLKTVFYNPLEEQKYKERRELTKLFVERGYGITKAIDSELPKIDIERDRYKNLLGGVLTNGFRKLESFISNECARTIKFLDREQMKSTSYMLLNCRVKLEPALCDSFYKFLRLGYGLGDVSVTEEEAVQLYVGIMRHLYGKSITMETCENMGRIKNRRDMENTLQALRQKAEREGARSSSRTYSQAEQMFPPDEPSCKNEEVWTSALLFEFVNLYVTCHNMGQIRESMGEAHNELQHFSTREFEVQLWKLVESGLKKIREDNMVYLPSGPFLLTLEPAQIAYIKKCPEEDGEEIRSLILTHLVSGKPDLLRHYIEEINAFIERAIDIDDYLEDEEEDEGDVQYVEQEQLHPQQNYAQNTSSNGNFEPMIEEIDPSLLDGLSVQEEEEDIYFGQE